jgi:hypothetical protein
MEEVVAGRGRASQNGANPQDEREVDDDDDPVDRREGHRQIVGGRPRFGNCRALPPAPVTVTGDSSRASRFAADSWRYAPEGRPSAGRPPRVARRRASPRKGRLDQDCESSGCSARCGLPARSAAFRPKAGLPRGGRPRSAALTCLDHAAQRSSRSESPVPSPRCAFARPSQTDGFSAGRERQDDRGEGVFHGATRAGQAEWAAAAILPPRKVEEAEIFSHGSEILLRAFVHFVASSFRDSLFPCLALTAAESSARRRCERPCQWHTARRREAGRRPQSPRLRAYPSGHSGPTRRRYAGRRDL